MSRIPSIPNLGPLNLAATDLGIYRSIIRTLSQKAKMLPEMERSNIGILTFTSQAAIGKASCTMAFFVAPPLFPPQPWGG